jgi:rhomboid protease GluP
MLILLVNGGLYAATMLYSMNSGYPGALTSIDLNTLFLFGGKFTRSIREGEWWRLITAGFLHGGILHILMNSWVMLDLGAAVEETFGAARMFVIYIAATVSGFWLSAWWSSNPSIGASAGIFGLIGAMIAFGILQRSSTGQMIRSHYTRWAIYGFVMGLLPGFRVDNAAHLGGLAGGFAVAYIAGSLPLRDFNDKLWNLLAAIAGLLTAYAFLQMFLRFQEYTR